MSPIVQHIGVRVLRVLCCRSKGRNMRMPALLTTLMSHDKALESLATPGRFALLRVSATPDFTATYLTPLLAQFAQRYPEISFEFDLTPRYVDLIAESFDIAIRLGRLPDSQLTVRKLGVARGGIYASPAYQDNKQSFYIPAEYARLFLDNHRCRIR